MVSTPLQSQAHFFMVRSERTAGYIPSYDSFADMSARSQKPLSQDQAFEVLIEDTIARRDDMAMPDQGALGKPNRLQDEGARFDIFDCLDMINPLQHIPVLNHIYRAMTGDHIKPISSIIGGALFGGPAGAASGLVTAVLEEGTGQSLYENVRSLASGDVAGREFGAYETASKRISANYDYNV